MSQGYYETVHQIERLHRHFLDLLKIELDKLGVQDINNVQALILYNIGDDELTVGELTLRGYYLGSNVSYNLKKMTEAGYLAQSRSVHDKRSTRVKLSDKGQTLRNQVADLYDRQWAGMKALGLTEPELAQVRDVLTKIERYWSSRIERAAFATAYSAAG